MPAPPPGWHSGAAASAPGGLAPGESSSDDRPTGTESVRENKKVKGRCIGPMIAESACVDRKGKGRAVEGPSGSSTGPIVHHDGVDLSASTGRAELVITQYIPLQSDQAARRQNASLNGVDYQILSGSIPLAASNDSRSDGPLSVNSGAYTPPQVPNAVQYGQPTPPDIPLRAVSSGSHHNEQRGGVPTVTRLAEISNSSSSARPMRALPRRASRAQQLSAEGCTSVPEGLQVPQHERIPENGMVTAEQAPPQTAPQCHNGGRRPLPQVPERSHNLRRPPQHMTHMFSARPSELPVSFLPSSGVPCAASIVHDATTSAPLSSVDQSATHSGLSIPFERWLDAQRSLTTPSAPAAGASTARNEVDADASLVLASVCSTPRTWSDALSPTVGARTTTSRYTTPDHVLSACGTEVGEDDEGSRDVDGPDDGTNYDDGGEGGAPVPDVFNPHYADALEYASAVVNAAVQGMQTRAGAVETERRGDILEAVWIQLLAGDTPGSRGKEGEGEHSAEDENGRGEDRLGLSACVAHSSTPEDDDDNEGLGERYDDDDIDELDDGFGEEDLPRSVSDANGPPSLPPLHDEIMPFRAALVAFSRGQQELRARRERAWRAMTLEERVAVERALQRD
jgi:hypothetical protein